MKGPPIHRNSQTILELRFGSAREALHDLAKRLASGQGGAPGSHPVKQIKG